MKVYTFTLPELEDLVNKAVDNLKVKLNEDGVVAFDKTEMYSIVVAEKTSPFTFVRRIISKDKNPKGEDLLYLVATKLS
jgi:hypothetical protein